MESGRTGWSFVKYGQNWSHIIWHQNKRAVAWPCLCKHCNITMMMGTNFFQQLWPVMKLGATTFSPSQKSKVFSRSAQIRADQKKSRSSTLVLAKYCFSSSIIRDRLSSIFWSMELWSMLNGIVIHYWSSGMQSNWNVPVNFLVGSSCCLIILDHTQPMQQRNVCRSSSGMSWALSPYSPDLSPCDFHIFGEFKKGLRGHQFQTENEGNECVCNWFK